MDGGGGGGNGKEKEEEQDGMSAPPSPRRAPRSSASTLSEEQSQVELEIGFFEAIEIYPLRKLRGMHRHFVMYGLMEFLRRSFARNFSPDDVMQLIGRFYDIEILEPDDEEIEILSHEEDFSLPQSYFVKEQS